MSKGTPKRSVRVEDEVWEKAQATAKDRGDNLSEVIRRSLTVYINDAARQVLEAAAPHLIREAMADAWDEGASYVLPGTKSGLKEFRAIQFANPYRHAGAGE